MRTDGRRQGTPEYTEVYFAASVFIGATRDNPFTVIRCVYECIALAIHHSAE